jgi:hypothetical protein
MDLVEFVHGLNYVVSRYEAIPEEKMLYFEMQEMGTLKELRLDRRNVGRSCLYCRVGFFADIRTLNGRVFIKL